MQKLSTFFYEKSSLLLAIIATALSFGYLFIVMTEHAKGFEVSGGTIFLGTSFGFSHEMVLEFLSARNPEKLNTYKAFLSITDLIYPVIYGLQYIFWISYLYKPFAGKMKWFNLTGILPTVLDWLENFQLIALTNQYLDTGSITKSAVQLASAFSISKWIVSVIIFLIIVVGIILRLKQFITSKN